jgi:hypothetical protein
VLPFLYGAHRLQTRRGRRAKRVNAPSVDLKT